MGLLESESGFGVGPGVNQAPQERLFAGVRYHTLNPTPCLDDNRTDYFRPDQIRLQPIIPALRLIDPDPQKFPGSRLWVRIRWVYYIGKWAGSKSRCGIIVQVHSSPGPYLDRNLEEAHQSIEWPIGHRLGLVTGSKKV